tara:strand:+ start:100 stop:492 length:393 start_codon:yes stop_codon:yes gene_type:complete
MDPDKLSLKSYGAGLQPPSFKRLNIHNILNRIISLNHAWKIAREDFGARNNITTALRRQKASWQASLLRYYPDAAYFKQDEDNVDGEELLSVRLSTPITIDGSLRNDAEHMPLRIAEELFTHEELASLIR